MAHLLAKNLEYVKSQADNDEDAFRRASTLARAIHEVVKARESIQINNKAAKANTAEYMQFVKHWLMRRGILHAQFIYTHAQGEGVLFAELARRESFTTMEFHQVVQVIKSLAVNLELLEDHARMTLTLCSDAEPQVTVLQVARRLFVNALLSFGHRIAFKLEISDVEPTLPEKYEFDDDDTYEPSPKRIAGANGMKRVGVKLADASEACDVHEYFATVGAACPDVIRRRMLRISRARATAGMNLLLYDPVDNMTASQLIDLARSQLGQTERIAMATRFRRQETLLQVETWPERVPEYDDVTFIERVDLGDPSWSALRTYVVAIALQRQRSNDNDARREAADAAKKDEEEGVYIDRLQSCSEVSLNEMDDCLPPANERKRAREANELLKQQLLEHVPSEATASRGAIKVQLEAPQYDEEGSLVGTVAVQGIINLGKERLKKLPMKKVLQAFDDTFSSHIEADFTAAAYCDQPANQELVMRLIVDHASGAVQAFLAELAQMYAGGSCRLSATIRQPKGKQMRPTVFLPIADADPLQHDEGSGEYTALIGN